MSVASEVAMAFIINCMGGIVMGVSLIVLGVFIIRLYFLKISKQNEKKILENGGKEYGVANSKRITILHILFYMMCIIEAIVRKTEFDIYGIIGVILIGFSLFMLYTVSNLLKGIWTIKLMLVNNHQYNDHWLFRTVKHPNYFLNITPELIGIALLCHAKLTAIVVLPLYAIVMYIRIKEEERLLKEVIIPNTKNLNI